MMPNPKHSRQSGKPKTTQQNHTAGGLCKTPFPSLLRRQEPSLKRSFSCRAGSRHQNMRNQIFEFIGHLSFSEKCATSKALLCAGHPPTRVRQISGFAKVSAGLFFKTGIKSLRRTALPLAASLLLGGCVVASAVDLAATTVFTVGKIAVKTTGAVVDAVIPDGKDDKDKKENSGKARKAESPPPQSSAADYRPAAPVYQPAPANPGTADTAQ